MNRRLRRWIAERRAFKAKVRAIALRLPWRPLLAECRAMDRYTQRLHEEAHRSGTVTLGGRWNDPTVDPLTDILAAIDTLK